VTNLPGERLNDSWALSVKLIVSYRTFDIKIVLVRKPEGKRRPGRPTPRCEDNIKINLKRNSVEVVGWVHMAWIREHQ
jgi:hypothetical protein